jgi:hypothetical protein
MDQTEAFLARVLPWDVHPAAYRNIHHKAKFVDNTGKSAMPGAACKTLAEAVAAAKKFGNQGLDTYVCMSLQGRAVEDKRVNGMPDTRYAIRNQTNTIGINNFYFDIDVKDGGYGSTEEILIALRDFIKATGMPNPTTITASGGGGVHAIWCTDTILQPTEWQLLSIALNRLAQMHGLRQDASVAKDYTRILRVPGTFNTKYTPMRLCHTLGKINPAAVRLADIKAILPADVLPSNVVTFQPRQAPLPAEESEFSAGVTLQSKPILIEEVAAHCPLVAQTLKDHGEHHSGGGIWHNMILLATFIENGQQIAHEFSSGHPEYSAAEVDAKYNEKVAARAASNKRVGWPSCATLSAAYPTGPCASCDKAKLGKSPLNFANPRAQEVVKFPPGYMQNSGGVFFVYPDAEEGKQNYLKVCPYPLEDPWLSLSYEGAFQLNFTFTKAKNQPVLGMLQADKIQQPTTLHPFMAKQQFNLGPDQTKPFARFAMSWMQELEQAGRPIISSPSLGWAGDDAKPEGFVYNNVMFTPTGVGRAPRLDNTMLGPWMPRGELSKWRAAAQFVIDQKRPALDLILASAFAGPLVRFTGHKGLLGAAYSPETGIGKTTAMSIATAVWGHPVESSQALDDTNYSALKRLGAIRSLTLFWDEVRAQGQDKTDKLANFIFALTTGRERTRMNSNLTMQPAGKWQTMLMMASNQSVLEIVKSATAATDAGGVRVFEWRVPPAMGSATITSSEASRIADAATSNYGQAGAVYAEWLGQNHAVAEQMVAKLSDALNASLNAVPDERFWVSSIACLLAGAKIAKVLGLVDFDMPALQTYCAQTINDLRRDRTHSRTIGADTLPKVLEMLGTYMAECKYDRTLETTGVAGGGMRVDNGADKLRSLDIHIDNTAGCVHLRSGPFVHWLYQLGLQKGAVVFGLSRLTGAHEQRVVLGAGTHYSTKVRTAVITIPLAALTT